MSITTNTFKLIFLSRFSGMPWDELCPEKLLPRACLFPFLAFPVCPETYYFRRNCFLGHACFLFLLSRYAPRHIISREIASLSIPVSFSCFPGMPRDVLFLEKSLFRAYLFPFPASPVCLGTNYFRRNRFLGHITLHQQILYCIKEISDNDNSNRTDCDKNT